MRFDRLAYAVDDLIVVLEPPERATSPREIVDEVRDCIDELGDLGDERGNNHESDTGHQQEREDEDDADRRAAAKPLPYERLDGRVEGARQHHGDEDPGQHLPGEIDEEQAKPHEHGDT